MLCALVYHVGKRSSSPAKQTPSGTPPRHSPKAERRTKPPPSTPGQPATSGSISMAELSTVPLDSPTTTTTTTQYIQCVSILFVHRVCDTEFSRLHSRLLSNSMCMWVLGRLQHFRFNLLMWGVGPASCTSHYHDPQLVRRVARKKQAKTVWYSRTWRVDLLTKL